MIQALQSGCFGIWERSGAIGMEARIALCKCKEGKNIYGVRFEKLEGGWKYTWAFPVKEAAAKREHYDETKIVGQIFPDNGYPGCRTAERKIS